LVLQGHGLITRIIRGSCLYLRKSKYFENISTHKVWQRALLLLAEIIHLSKISKLATGPKKRPKAKGAHVCKIKLNIDLERNTYSNKGYNSPGNIYLSSTAKMINNKNSPARNAAAIKRGKRTLP
jgi:hypothetical protein